MKLTQTGFTYFPSRITKTENTNRVQRASGRWWHPSSDCALNFSCEALCPSLTWIISSKPIRKRTPDDKHPGIMLSIHLPHLSVWQSISCRQVGSSYKVAMSVATGWIVYHSKGLWTLDMQQRTKIKETNQQQQKKRKCPILGSKKSELLLQHKIMTENIFLCNIWEEQMIQKDSLSQEILSLLCFPN